MVFSPVSLTAWESGNVVFSCTSRGNPLPTITWNITQLGSLVNSSQQITVDTRENMIAKGTGLFTVRLSLAIIDVTKLNTIQVTSDLLLTNIQTEMDQWSFFCEATNTLLGGEVSQDTSEEALLSVTSKAQIQFHASLTLDPHREHISGCPATLRA